MTIKKFIESAIEGGWNEEFFSEVAKVQATNYSLKFIYRERETTDPMSEWLYHMILLDPLAWQAVYGRDDDTWKAKMLGMTNALINGSSIDDTYLNEDSLEILHRLYDSENTLNKVVVNIDKPEEDIISFLPAKRFRPQRTVCTSDSEVRLRKSKYKIKVNDRYIKKITKSGEVKYTQKIKKAKKFNLKNLEEFELIINQEE